ncbi:hypothetical protein DFH11DRAFT_1587608 [Phellopilus nigrolimitatus]|nr:hypothetical protein DFH11DRAFT_1587608 [Phellopilus nigrolimitatus]
MWFLMFSSARYITRRRARCRMRFSSHRTRRPSIWTRFAWLPRSSTDDLCYHVLHVTRMLVLCRCRSCKCLTAITHRRISLLSWISIGPR